jgi:hypothetical protein
MQDLIQAGIDHLALLGQAPTNRDEGTQANADFPSIIIEEKAWRFLVNLINTRTG